MTVAPVYPSKPCSKCGETKPLTDFYIKDKRTRRLYSWCKACHTAMRMAIYTPALPKPPQTEKRCPRCGDTKPIAAFEHKPGTKSQVRSWCRECTRIKERTRKATNKERTDASNAAYRATHAAELAERQRQWRIDNPDAYRAIHSKWKHDNKPTVNASTHKRRARIKGNGGSWTAYEWERLKAQCDWRCLMCGKQEMTDGITLCFDHIVPVSRGGMNIIGNGQPLCKSCNSTKHTAVLDLRGRM